MQKQSLPRKKNGSAKMSHSPGEEHKVYGRSHKREDVLVISYGLNYNSIM